MSCLLTQDELEAALKTLQSTSTQDLRQSADLNLTASALDILHNFLRPSWPVPTRYTPRTEPAPDQVIQALSYLLDRNRQEELFDWFKDQIQIIFVQVQHETRKIQEEHNDSKGFRMLLRLIARWHVIFLTWYEPLRALTPEDTSAYDLYSQHFYSLLLPYLPRRFPCDLKALFSADLSDPPLLFTPVSSEISFTPLQQLTALGLLQRFQPVLFSVGYDAIDKRVRQTCQGEWHTTPECSLQGVLDWFRRNIGMWLFKVFEAAENSSTPSREARERVIEIMKPAMSRYEYHIYKSLSELRIDELFDIIVEFPDTMPVLQDLRICLSKTDQRSLLVNRLRDANTRRLLHPGADTQDIITQYISLMKALKVLDPPGVLLSCVAHPVRSYLRGREDTIRCIVTSLVEPGHSLGDELDQPPEDSRDVRGIGDGLPLQEEGDFSPNWAPDPVDAPVGYKDGLKGDVIESLVSIYETQDGFVKELQSLLASRLLTIKDYDVTQELTRVEILKKRFGEASLQPCDIMLKDMADSKRMDSAIHEVIPEAPVHATIISHCFWPDMKSTNFRLSPQLENLQVAFEKAYANQKIDRRVKWFPQLGTVDVEISLEDRTLNLEVTTLQASVIDLFSNQGTWTSEDLSQALKLKSKDGILRNALYFWSNQEILKESEPEVWKLFETRDEFQSSSKGITNRHVIEDHNNQLDSDQEKIEKTRVLSVFIIGMLTNLGVLPFERIFMIMNTVMPGFKGTSKEELNQVLELMNTQGQIMMVGQQQWKVCK